MAIYYDGYVWDIDGFPGEYVYGDDVYVDDFYMDARWKPVYGYPGYWVSNKGQVYGPGRYGQGNFLKPTPDKTGHLYVTISNKYGHRKVYVHQLQAMAFIENPNGLPMVRHLDDISDHNEDLDNLAWGTAYDNVHDSIRNGTAYCLKCRIPIQAKDLYTGETWIFESQTEAARSLNVSEPLIGKVLMHKINHTNGYTFAYLDENIDDRPDNMLRHRNTKILATNLNTGENAIFNTQKEASKVLGIGSRMINRVVKGNRPYTHGYSFKYLYDRGGVDE